MIKIRGIANTNCSSIILYKLILLCSDIFYLMKQNILELQREKITFIITTTPFFLWAL